MPALSSHHARGIAIAAGGTLLISFDSLLVRLADTTPWNVVFWRGSLICLSLLIYQLLRGPGARWLPSSRGEAVAALAVLLLLGANMTLFVISVSTTLVANTVIILSSAPFFAALLSWVFLRERIALRTWIAIATAMGGVVLIFGGSVGGGTLFGDLCAVAMALFMGTSLTILRRYPGIDRISVVCASGLVATLVAWPWGQPLSLELSSYAALSVMGLVQMPAAMVLFATATRYLPSAEVALFILIESVMGPIWVWLVVGEVPPPLTFVGGAVILLTVAIHAALGLRESRRQRGVDADCQPPRVRTRVKAAKSDG